MGAERLENRVVVDNEVVDAAAKVEEEPDDDDGREAGADFGGAKGLNREEDDNDGAGDAHNGIGAELWVGDPDALNGAQHRLGGREDAVGQDEGDTEHADHFESDLRRLAGLQKVPDFPAETTQIFGPVALERDSGGHFRVAVDNVGVPREEGV